MKTYNHLYPQIACFANLDEAWHKARRGKRGKEAAARFEENAEGEMFHDTAVQTPPANPNHVETCRRRATILQPASAGLPCQPRV